MTLRDLSYSPSPQQWRFNNQVENPVDYRMRYNPTTNSWEFVKGDMLVNGNRVFSYETDNGGSFMFRTATGPVLGFNEILNVPNTGSTPAVGYFDNQQTSRTYSSIASGGIDGGLWNITSSGQVRFDDTTPTNVSWPPNGTPARLRWAGTNPAFPNGFDPVRGNFQLSPGNFFDTVANPRFPYSGPSVSTGGGLFFLEREIDINYQTDGHLLFRNEADTPGLGNALPDTTYRVRLVGGTLPAGATGMVEGVVSGPFTDTPTGFSRRRGDLYNIGGVEYLPIRIGSAADIRAAFGTGNALSGNGGTFIIEQQDHVLPTFTNQAVFNAGHAQSGSNQAGYYRGGFFVAQSPVSGSFPSGYAVGDVVRWRENTTNGRSFIGRIHLINTPLFSGAGWGMSFDNPNRAVAGLGYRSIFGGPGWVLEKAVV